MGYKRQKNFRLDEQTIGELETIRLAFGLASDASAVISAIQLTASLVTLCQAYGELNAILLTSSNKQQVKQD